jgi:hypothetical protein
MPSETSMRALDQVAVLASASVADRCQYGPRVREADWTSMNFFGFLSAEAILPVAMPACRGSFEVV